MLKQKQRNKRLVFVSPSILAIVVVSSVIVSLFMFWQVTYLEGPLEESENLTQEVKQAQTAHTNISKPIANEHVTESVFVPYWTSSELSGDYDEYIYFGIAVDEEGELIEDSGYQSLYSYMSTIPQKKRSLTLRMLDRDVNVAILKEPATWKALANTVLTQVNNSGGLNKVILDLEVGLLAFNISEQEITDFVTFLSNSFAQNNIEFGMTLYGDTLYRSRPYDLAALNDVSDSFYIMAYDFHKSFGLPGPNFPFQGKKEYGYDFETMITEISQEIPPEELTVIFGMFGYEWQVDEKGRPLSVATAMSLNEIRSKYNEDECMDCKFTREDLSKERNIEFANSSGERFIVWYEDEESVEIKKNYAQEQGIGSFSYWAAGYY